MGIQYFGEYHNPTTDDANSPSGPTVSLTPPSNMVEGDFVLVSLVYRGQVTWTNSTTGGQTWSSSANTQSGTTNTARLFWCRYNGTWTADPVFTVTTGTAGAQGWMVVFRGVNGPVPWDVTPVISAQTASLTFVVATYNTNTPTALAIVGASSQDNNTWSIDNSFGPPSGSGNIYWRSASGTDNSLVIATKPINAPGAVGQTTMTQTNLGADLGTEWYGALRDAPEWHAQAQAHIKATDKEFAQAQASIIYVVTAYGQAQAQIIAPSVETRVYGQSQANILQTYNGYGQASVHILKTDRGYAQSAANILQTYTVFAQSAVHILATYTAWAQGNAHILTTYVGYAQAQATISLALTTYDAYGQSQAAISVGTDIYQYIDELVPSNNDYILTDYAPNLVTYIAALEDMNEPEYRQDHILKFRIRKLGPGSATLTVELLRGDDLIATRTVDDLSEGINTYSTFLTQNELNLIPDYANLRVLFNATAGADTKVYVTWFEFQAPSGNTKIRRAFGQAQAEIQLGVHRWIYAQAGAAILATSTRYAQANAHIYRPENAYAQAQAHILITQQVYAQATATILAQYVQYAQAQAQIRQQYLTFAQAQANVKNTYQSYAQAQVWIKVTDNVTFGQAQAQIIIPLLTQRAYAQARAKIIYLDINKFGQAQAHIKTFDIQAYAQAQANVKTTYRAYAQAQATITKSSTVYGQASAKIILVDVTKFGQAQARIKTTYQVYANAQAQIKTTYQGYANAQGLISASVSKCGQAQAAILQTYAKVAQTNAVIKTSYTVYGQAGAHIRATSWQNAQAQALIIKAAGYGQAEAYILIVNYLKRLELSDSTKFTLTLGDQITLDLTLIDSGITIELNDIAGLSINLEDRSTDTLDMLDRNY